MKGKTIKALLISTTMTATILTGCGSNDTTLTTENETATIDESTTEFETDTTEEKTSTVEEITTEEETSTVEENATEVETTTEEESSTSDSDDAVTRRKNYKTEYKKNFNDNYELYSDFDVDGDGVITDEEAADLYASYLEAMGYEPSTSSSTNSSSSTSSSSSSSSTIGTPFNDVVPDKPNASEMDDAGFSTTGDVY
jgi:uncharacterized protein YcfL